MPTYLFDGTDSSYTMPLDVLERKYYPISAECTPIGPQLTFDQLIQSMKDNDKQSVPPKCSVKDVLPNNFLKKSTQDGVVLWDVPAYTIDGSTITFDPEFNGKTYDAFVKDVTAALAAHRASHPQARQPPHLPPLPAQYRKIPAPRYPPLPLQYRKREPWEKAGGITRKKRSRRTKRV